MDLECRSTRYYENKDDDLREILNHEGAERRRPNERGSKEENSQLTSPRGNIQVISRGAPLAGLLNSVLKTTWGKPSNCELSPQKVYEGTKPISKPYDDLIVIKLIITHWEFHKMSCSMIAFSSLAYRKRYVLSTFSYHVFYKPHHMPKRNNQTAYKAGNPKRERLTR
ncbi:hypothetical protein Cgig2_027883 [Carnegiea gigantea]|uniref:Uncharacterized protein n=1 Tax=Carnegiea gigantea TaxID=171969 RepID=A0A9Q1KNE6_9CARY|nr:hypothetical protein Cgig2_027883 [Carnegiea gigantea]